VTALEDLILEHRRERVGPKILAEVRQSCTRVAKRSYPPRPYAQSETWDEDALADLVQDVVLDRLVRERQIEFLVEASPDLRQFRTLLDRQVRLTLAKRRQRTVIDNLLDRTVRLLNGPGFEVAVAGPPVAFKASGTDPEAREPTDAELALAVGAARQVPRQKPGSGRERAPSVYGRAELRRVVDLVFAALPTVVRRRDLDRIFAGLLTPWVAGRLVPYEEALTDADGPFLTPAETQEVDEAVKNLRTSLGEAGLAVVAAKLDGTSDAQLARLLGVSRPTAAKRKNEVNSAIASAFEPLSAAGRGEAMCRLSMLVGEAKR